MHYRFSNHTQTCTHTAQHKESIVLSIYWKIIKIWNKGNVKKNNVRNNGGGRRRKKEERENIALFYYFIESGNQRKKVAPALSLYKLRGN